MKTYVLDTSVIIHDPDCFYKFEENNVLIPYVVLQELDGLKNAPGEKGFAARKAQKNIESILTNGDSNVRIFRHNDLDGFSSNDEYIVCAAKYDKVLVSRDVGMRILAHTQHVLVEDYENTQIKEQYSGYKVVEITDPWYIDRLYSGQQVPVSELGIDAVENEYVVLQYGESKSAISVCKDGELHAIQAKSAYGLVARNLQQRLALHALLDEDIKLVTLTGNAGSGKTLLALAAALEQRRNYHQVVLTRPIVPLSGKDLGFLPGPQPLDAKVLSSTGWTTMGDLSVGSSVIAASTGKACKVIGVYPKGTKPVYRITTIDGETTECCLDHLWLTQTREERKRGKKGKVRSTSEILGTLLNSKGEYNHFLPRTSPVSFQETELPLSPYVLGCLLGNGCFGNSISLHTPYQEIVDRVGTEINDIGCGLTVSRNTSCINCNITTPYSLNNKTAKRVRIKTSTGDSTYHSVGVASKALNINARTIGYRCKHNTTVNDVTYSFLPSQTRWTNKVKEAVDCLGLLGKTATTKFIPKQYLYGTTDKQRLDLLRGLMDTDGAIHHSKLEASFSTSSPQLAQDVRELVLSLGGKCKLRSRDRREASKNKKIKSKHISYEFTISIPHLNPFFVKEKAVVFAKRYQKDRKPFMQGRAIKSIEYVGEKQVQCILIDDPSHLYITDDYLVTHNTITDKVDPYNGPFNDNLSVLRELRTDNGKDIDNMRQTEKIKVEAMPYIRGRSFNKIMLISDECQNMTRHEVKTLVTRVGDGTKLVLTGDINQIDIAGMDEYSNGLSYLISRMKGQPMFAHITLAKSERSPLAELAAKVL